MSPHQSRNLAVSGPSPVLTITKLELFHGSPEVKSSAALTNNQLVFPAPDSCFVAFKR